MNVVEIEKNVLIGYFLIWIVCILLAALLGYFQYLDKKKLQKKLVEKRRQRVIDQRQIEGVILRNKLAGDINAYRMAKQIVAELNKNKEVA